MSWDTRPLLMSMTAAVSATDSPAWRSSRATRRDSLAAWCCFSIASAVIFRGPFHVFLDSTDGHGQVDLGVIGVDVEHRGHEVADLLDGGGQGAALGHPHILDVQFPAVFPLHGLDVVSAHGNHPFGRHDRR